MLRAGFGYLAIVAVLFHRLVLGEVLSPAANLWDQVPFRSVLAEDVTPYLNGIQGDVWREFEPWHRAQYRAACAGRFPLWGPHIFGGFPVHANGQSALLSPFHAAYFLADPKWAAGPVAALKLWVAGFGTFLLGRRLGLAPAAAFLAGIGWMLAAFNVRWLQWNHSAAAAWLPVVLCTTDRLVERVSAVRLACAGLAAVALELSGHPETQFHVAALTGLFVLVRIGTDASAVRSKVAALLACLAAQLIGLAGAAAALVPFAEQLASSADWVESTHALGRTLPPEAWLGALAPDYFGRPRAGQLYHGPLNYNEIGLYIGITPLALAATAIALVAIRPRRTARGPAGAAIVIFTVWAAVCGSVVLGVPGVSGLIHHVPLFSKADNLRLLLGVQFAGCMLAGSLWTQLVRAPTRVAACTLVAASALTLVALGTMLVLPGPHGLAAPTQGLRQLWADPSEPARLENRSLRMLASLLCAMAGAVWALGTARRLVASRTRHGACTAGTGPSGLAGVPIASAAPVRDPARDAERRWSSGLLLIVLVDLLWVAYGFNPIVPARVVFPPAPAGLARVLDALEGRRLIATDEILSPNVAMAYEFRDLRGYDFPLDLRTSTLFRRLGWKPGITLVPRDQLLPAVRAEVQSVCDKAAVAFLYTNIRLPRLEIASDPRAPQRSHPGWRLVQSGPGKDAVYQNRGVYPRGYLAGRVRVADPAAALAALLDVDRDLRVESIVEEPLDGITPRAPEVAAGEAVIERDAGEEVMLQTRCSAAALLVLSDRFDPGWRVEIDGVPGRSLRVNYLFRGVVVPAGTHHVRWVYQPRSVVWGAVLSGATLLGLAALFVREALRRWRRPRS